MVHAVVKEHGISEIVPPNIAQPLKIAATLLPDVRVNPDSQPAANCPDHGNNSHKRRQSQGHEQSRQLRLDLFHFHLLSKLILQQAKDKDHSQGPDRGPAKRRSRVEPEATPAPRRTGSALSSHHPHRNDRQPALAATIAAASMAIPVSPTGRNGRGQDGQQCKEMRSAKGALAASGGFARIVRLPRHYCHDPTREVRRRQRCDVWPSRRTATRPEGAPVPPAQGNALGRGTIVTPDRPNGPIIPRANGWPVGPAGKHLI